MFFLALILTCIYMILGFIDFLRRSVPGFTVDWFVGFGIFIVLFILVMLMIAFFICLLLNELSIRRKGEVLSNVVP